MILFEALEVDFVEYEEPSVADDVDSRESSTPTTTATYTVTPSSTTNKAIKEAKKKYERDKKISRGHLLAHGKQFVKFVR